MHGKTVIETGSGKPVGLQGDSERTRAIRTRSAYLHVGKRQPSMRRIKQAGHTTALDPTLGAGQGKKPCRRGRLHKKALTKTWALKNNPSKPYNSILGRRRIGPQTIAIMLNSNILDHLAITQYITTDKLNEYGQYLRVRFMFFGQAVATRQALHSTKSDQRTFSRQHLTANGVLVPLSDQRDLAHINWTRLTLHSISWPPATGRPNAPPNPTVCESAVEAPDSRDRIGNRYSESLSFESRGQSSRRRCSATEPKGHTK